jgi:SAM-dependent methyltransferase
MPWQLYREGVAWYRLLDPAQEHAEEAASFAEAFERSVAPAPRTLLELGAGAGHNALHLKRRFACTLVDPSPEMQALSRELNPECEHVLGDMRDVRLGRAFDAVLVHDAVVYMTSEAELAAAARTAFVHTRPGGAALFAPDLLRDGFREQVEPLAGDEGARSLRGVAWVWDPDPADDTYTVDYALLLREGGAVRAVHDRHVEGLFSRATWLRVLAEAGYEVGPLARPIGNGAYDEVFLCLKAGSGTGA